MLKTIADNGVSSGARHLFHILKDFARGKNWPECWPGKWRLAEETGRSLRMVQYYLRELQEAGAIEVVREDGKRNRYRILLGIKDKIIDTCTEAPLQPIAGVGLQPIAGVGLQPIAGVGVSSLIEEAISKQAARATEVPAAAAEINSLGGGMNAVTKSVLDQLLAMGMPLSAEVKAKVELQPDFARDVLRHCKIRFGKGKKPVDNPGGYITALIRDPSKFGWVRRDAVWCDPERRPGLTEEEVAKREEVQKAASKALLAKIRSDSEQAYHDRKAVWDRLPDEAKQEIRDFVMKELPLFHAHGADSLEFELQCMGEAFTFRRAKWRQKHLGTGPGAAR